MFDNAGGSIKLAAKIFTWIGSIGYVIAGIWLMSYDLFEIGVPILIFGPISSWLSNLLVYGFGELIEKTTEIAENTAHLRPVQKAEKQVVNEAEIKTTNNHYIVNEPVTEYRNPPESFEEDLEMEEPEYGAIINDDGTWTCPECCRVHKSEEISCKCGFRIL